MSYTKWLLPIALLTQFLGAYGAGAESSRGVSAVGNKGSVLNGLPILFEKNFRQDASSYKYLARQGSLHVKFGFDRVTFVARGDAKQDGLVLKFIGSNRKLHFDALDPQIAEVNYLMGPDPSHWHTHVQTFREVLYKNLYPGVDLTFYGNGRDLEHDFALAPGTDPASITLELDGGNRLSMDHSGDLVVATGSGEVRLTKPVAYQLTATGRQLVEAQYRLKGNRISFRTGTYDRQLPLVIDPVFVYSTWLAGSHSSWLNGGGSDTVAGVAVDSGGNVYVSGTTSSTDFPVQGGYPCSACKQSLDLFVTKLDPSGSSLIYSTYIGGSGADQALAIGVDGNGNALVAGTTGSSDFPLVNSYTTYSGATTTYGFILSLSSSGSQLNYSSLLGQVEPSIFAPGYPGAFSVDRAGNAYLTGITYDPAFPLTPGTIGNTIQHYPFPNLFLTKLNAQGDISYSTVIPGTLPYANYSFNLNDFNPYALDLDASGNAYVGGAAGPGLPTTAGTISPSFAGDPNNPSSYVGFVLKINSNASAVSFGTYLPTTDFVRAIAPHSSGVFVAGATSSTQFPTTPGAFQTTMLPSACMCNAGYIGDLNAGATAYNYATYLAGTPATTNEGTSIMSLSLDSASNLWVSGVTASADFPLRFPVSANFPNVPPNVPFGHGVSGFVTEIQPDLSKLVSSTFLGGWDGMYHTRQLFLTTGSSGTAFVAGNTDDSDWPTTPGSFEPTLPSGGPGNVHTGVAKLDTTVPSAAPLFSSLYLSFSSGFDTSSAPQRITVTNVGNANMQFVGASFSSSDYSQTNTCSSPVPPGSSCYIDVTFTPEAVGSSEQTMVVSTNGGVAEQPLYLFGTGLPGFYLTPAGNGSASQTVSSGQTARFALTLNSAQFTGTVALTCSGAPQYATCSVSPSSEALNNSAQDPLTVTVATNLVGSAAASRWNAVYGTFVLALAVAPLGLRTRVRSERSRTRAHAFLLAYLFVLAFVLVGCGGGSGSGGTTTHAVAPGTYKLQVSAAGGGIAQSITLTLTVQ